MEIFYKNELISFISAGVFREKSTRKILSRIAKNYQLDIKLIKEKYFNSLSDNILNIKLIEGLLEIVSVYLSQIYENLQINNPQLFKKIKYNSTEEYILQHVLIFIDKNFKEDFTVLDLTKFCHCSESYLNHLFKRKMGINIRNYINNLRIAAAKKMLINSKALIKNIATSVGYNDPNYFSKVFKETCKISASEYRKKLKT